MQLSSEQQRYELEQDKSETFSLLLSYRAAPSRFLLSDGSKLGGGLARFRGGIGFGQGRPSSGFAWFVGAYADQAYVSEWPAIHQHLEALNANMLQYFLTARVGFKGTSLSYGFLGHSGTFLNAAGGFGEIPYYRGGPPAEAQNQLYANGYTDKEPFGSNSHMLTLRNEHGVGVGAAISRLTKQTSDGALEQAADLSALQAILAPEDLLREVGLFRLGVDRFSEAVDYYRDKAMAESKALAGETLSGYSPGALVQIPAGVDNFLDQGIHLRIATQVAPKAVFRQAMAGWLYQQEISKYTTFAAGRAGMVRRGDSYLPTVELSAGMLSDGLSGAVTYAYNAPDAAGFFPVPNAHVVGIHLGWHATLSAVQSMPVVSKKKGKGD